MAKIYGHKPLRKSEALSRTLAAIETPDCDCILCCAGEPGYPATCPGEARCQKCPQPFTCEHIRSVEDHGFSVDEWARLLWHNDREGYAEPPTPAGKISLSRDGRVAKYFCRSHEGYALFAPDDMPRRERHGKQAEELDEVTVQAVSGKANTGVKLVDATAEWFPVRATGEAWERAKGEVACCRCVIVRQTADALLVCQIAGGLKRQERERLRQLLSWHEPPVNFPTLAAVLGQLGLEWERMR